MATKNITLHPHCTLILNEPRVNCLFLFIPNFIAILLSLLRLRSREFIFDVFIRIYEIPYRAANFTPPLKSNFATVHLRVTVDYSLTRNFDTAKINCVQCDVL